MFGIFEKYIRERADLTAAEMEAVRAVCIEKRLRKRQYLLQEGELCHHKCFITKGCLRQFRVSETGSEHILRFGIEHWWLSDRESYHSGKPSKSYIEALEDTEVIYVERADFSELKANIPNFRNMIEKLEATSFDASQNRIMNDLSYTAEQKYRDFMDLFPDLSRRVPLHMIASYLGVSRETLSRVRKHLAHG